MPSVRCHEMLPPGMETRERECWYINVSAVDRFNFTDAMVRAANF